MSKENSEIETLRKKISRYLTNSDESFKNLTNTEIGIDQIAEQNIGLYAKIGKEYGEMGREVIKLGGKIAKISKRIRNLQRTTVAILEDLILTTLVGENAPSKKTGADEAEEIKRRELRLRIGKIWWSMSLDNAHQWSEKLKEENRDLRAVTARDMEIGDLVKKQEERLAARYRQIGEVGSILGIVYRMHDMQKGVLTAAEEKENLDAQLREKNKTIAQLQADNARLEEIAKCLQQRKKSLAAEVVKLRSNQGDDEIGWALIELMAEERFKTIAQLEEENDRLKKKLEALEKMDKNMCNTHDEIIGRQDKTIARLEAENARLKQQLAFSRMGPEMGAVGKALGDYVENRGNNPLVPYVDGQAIIDQIINLAEGLRQQAESNETGKKLFQMLATNGFLASLKELKEHGSAGHVPAKKIAEGTDGQGPNVR